jgi:hypothetical protein
MFQHVKHFQLEAVVRRYDNDHLHSCFPELKYIFALALAHSIGPFLMLKFPNSVGIVPGKSLFSC